jgi:hypothetical protein
VKARPLSDYSIDPAADMIGQKFGRLTVLCFHSRQGLGKRRSLLWKCRCHCGSYCVVPGRSLRSGHTLSCGCLQAEASKEAVTKHGMTGTAEHKAWLAMKQRCVNSNDAGFHNYGGRGLSVCERWNDFSAFLADMGPRPTHAHSLERIDNNQGYGPDNCMWANKKTQCNNQRRSVRITFNGVTQTLMQWSEATGINYGTLRKRRRHGWTAERMLTTAPDKRFSTR